jgi:DNA-binding response OmpR family regulator
MSETFAAMVLDLGLPRLSGLALLAWLRARRDALPVLILTARDTLADRVTGLDTGADDYLVKPFALAELAARLRALVRRGAGVAVPLLRWRAVVLDPASHQVSLAGATVALTVLEFALLHTLLLGQGRVFERAHLEQKLYRWGEEVDSNAIEVLVHRLRKKLGNDIIRTVRGVGYALGEA